MRLTAQHVRDEALRLGFSLAGLTPARPAPHLAAYFGWIEAGRHGEMRYLERPDRLERRRDLNRILPGARTLIAVGLDYGTPGPPAAVLQDPARGRIAAYAWGIDYHTLMLPRLEALARWLRAESGQAVRWRAYVDTGPLLERDHAWQAGLGFLGKNTLVIHPRRGSDFFLGEIVTDWAPEAYDPPQAETRCGTCARCLQACPTSAFPRPHVLDARRCVSYLTIEQRGWIDRALRPQMGNWIFGCDVCQAVCPWQRFAAQTSESSLRLADPEHAAPRLVDLLRLDDLAFDRAYRGTALQRLGRDRLVRNACIAAGNAGGAAEGLRVALAAALRRLLADDSSPIVRGHAAWALGRLAGPGAGLDLRARLEAEAHTEVREEIQAALARSE